MNRRVLQVISAAMLFALCATVAFAQEENADYSGVIIRKGEPELLEAINKALAEIKADGTYEKISQKYFGADVSK